MALLATDIARHTPRKNFDSCTQYILASGKHRRVAHRPHSHSNDELIPLIDMLARCYSCKTLRDGRTIRTSLRAHPRCRG